MSEATLAPAGFSEPEFKRPYGRSETGSSALAHVPTQYVHLPKPREGRLELAPGCYRRIRAKVCP